MLPMDMPGIWMGQKEINYWLPFHNEEGGQMGKVRQTNPIRQHLHLQLANEESLQPSAQNEVLGKYRKGTQEVNYADSK